MDADTGAGQSAESVPPGADNTEPLPILTPFPADAAWGADEPAGQMQDVGAPTPMPGTPASLDAGVPEPAVWGPPGGESTGHVWGAGVPVGVERESVAPTRPNPDVVGVGAAPAADVEAPPMSTAGAFHWPSDQHPDNTAWRPGAVASPAAPEPPRRFSNDPLDFGPDSTAPPNRYKWPLTIAAAVLAALIVAAGLIVLLTRPGTQAQPTTTASAPTTSVSKRDSEAETRLLAMLPAGYPASTCKGVEPADDALAQVNCGTNTDPDGPMSATYMLVGDKSALTEVFRRLMQGSSVVVCPGRIQSPGPWRRNATPDQVSGTVFCGLAHGGPTVGWTDEARLLLSQTRSGSGGPTLDQLYAWWSVHS